MVVMGMFLLNTRNLEILLCVDKCLHFILLFLIRLFLLLSASKSFHLYLLTYLNSVVLRDGYPPQRVKLEFMCSNILKIMRSGEQKKPIKEKLHWVKRMRFSS